ncbi:MAG: hypothetical protein PVH61_22575 [Candidatus Aminicenantes bacterium]|jgi:hypothetical protein
MNKKRNYKLQITNKIQITMSEITNSPGGLNKNTILCSSPQAYKTEKISMIAWWYVPVAA